MAADFLYFGSGSADYTRLSNLYHCTVTLTLATLDPALMRRQPQLVSWMEQAVDRTVTFPSVEHLYQALKARDHGTFLRFTTGGNLAQWNPYFFLLTVVPGKKHKYAKKLGRRVQTLTAEELGKLATSSMKHWQRRNLLGVVAKLAANIRHGPALDLGPTRFDYAAERLPPDQERDLWLALEKLKYGQHADLRQLLVSTGPKRLIEFDHHAKAGSTHWGGLMRHGQLIGDNAMGDYLMATRESFIE